ncbi:DinB family protein [Nocardiopsis exhalans]|uniref:DinB family protein n=1 Tax=Nocardiopsis exhalans TaxID=163604 RepID=A0ABY5D8H5_9ACTN|nr:DinB family protein [Nocardiopsis exhalans]USY20642.1 DinB family protein [Nocardiopsis exhalans]
MPDYRRDLLRDQYDMTWALFEYHLERLQPEDFLWEPAELCWTLRQGPGGVWTPDWADSEPDPVPVPTIAWLTWHIGWWWTVTLDHTLGRTPQERAEIRWPGEERTADWLRGLNLDWVEALSEVDLDSPASFPWQGANGKTNAHTAAWVNSELMKNAAEVGQLRMLRAALKS